MVAEIGAAFLCAELEVTNTPRLDHAQYCSHWLEILKGDQKAIFSAAALATRTVEYLIGLQPKLGLGTDPEAEPDAATDQLQRKPAAAGRPEGPS